jgi:hypothetical protein
MKRVQLFSFCLAILLLLSAGANCQNTFSKIFPVDFEDGRSGMSINLLKDGYLISSDFQSGPWTALYKTDFNGNLIWKKKYWLEFTCSDPELTLVKNEKIYIAGFKNPDSTILRNATVFVCLDLNGNILWSKTYRKEGFYEQGMRLVENENGFLVCSRRFTNIPFEYELVVYKMDTLGNVLNEKIVVPRTNRPYKWSSARYRDGKYYLSARIARQRSNSIEDAGLYELDSNLNILDSLIIPDRGYVELGINYYLPLRNNKRLFAWHRDTFMRVPPYRSIDANMVLYFLDSNNVEERRIAYFNECQKYFYNLKELANGDILGVGVREPGCFFLPEQITKSLVMRLSPTGQIKWQRYIVDSLYGVRNQINSFFLDFEEDKQGNFIISGAIFGNNGRADVWLVKLDSNGCLHPNCPNEEIRVGYLEIEEPVSITVFPNPATEILTIQLPKGFSTEGVKIFDSMGRLWIEKGKTTEESLQIAIKDLANGVYFVEVIDKNRKQHRLSFVKTG